MGYDIHITRSPSWTSNAGLRIHASEWSAVVREDPDLLPDPKNGPYAVVWRGLADGEEGWFDWSDGNVYTSDPSPKTLAKMLEIARRLDAHVQGDDGERYVLEDAVAVRQDAARESQTDTETAIPPRNPSA